MRYLLIAILLVGCSQSKQLAKAKQRVLLDNKTFNEVGAKWRELNACSNDTIITTITDTLPTLEIWANTDTVKVNDTVTIIKTIERVKPIVKKIREVVTDNQHINQLRDTIKAWQNEAIRLSGKVEQLTIDRSQQHNKRVKWQTAFFGLLALVVLLLVGLYRHRKTLFK